MLYSLCTLSSGHSLTPIIHIVICHSTKLCDTSPLMVGGPLNYLLTNENSVQNSTPKQQKMRAPRRVLGFRV